MITEKELNEIIGLFIRTVNDMIRDSGYHFQINTIPEYGNIKQKLKEKGILKPSAKEEFHFLYKNIDFKIISTQSFASIKSVILIIEDLYNLGCEAIKEAEEKLNE